MQSPNLDKYDLSSCTSFGGGGAAMLPAVSRAVESRTAATPRHAWGLTESNAAGTSVMGPEYLGNIRTCGRAHAPLIELKIVDGDGRLLPPGARGEICMKSATNVRGYFRNKVRTTGFFGYSILPMFCPSCHRW